MSTDNAIPKRQTSEKILAILHAIIDAGGYTTPVKIRSAIGELFNLVSMRIALQADLVRKYTNDTTRTKVYGITDKGRALLPPADRYDRMPVEVYRALDASDREAARGRAYNNVDKAKAQAARLAAAEAAITIHEEFAAATKVVFDVNTDYDGTTVRLRRIENRDGELLWTDTAGTIGGHPDDDGEWDADSIAGDLLARAHEFDSTVFDHIGTSLYPSRYDFDFEPLI